MSDEELRSEITSIIYGADWEVNKAFVDMSKPDVEAVIELIAADRVATEKAYGGCHKCYGKGYATVRKGTTAKGKTWDLRTHIKYCSCDRGKQLEKQLQGSDTRSGGGE